MSINETPKRLQVATAFSGGLAAPEFALKYENMPHDIVFACEWDKYARQQYIKFHGKPKHFFKDIKDLNAKKFLGLVFLFVWGSPCQDLSLSGNREGLEGSKSSHFWHGLRVQGEIKPPIFIFENVVGLLSSNGRADFKMVCAEFRKQGYHIHVSKLNAKDFGDPQNRDRILIIGFLDSEEYHKYQEPKPIKLEKCLKDVLQKWVPEKYFLSQKMVDGLVLHSKKQQNRPTNNFLKVGYINQDTQASSVASSVASTEGVSNALTSGTHGYSQGYILNQIGYLNKNLQGARVYDTQCAVTLSSNGGGVGAKTGLYQIKSNTKTGYEIAKDYDCINIERPSSTTRRGRVGKGYAQTLQTGGNIGVIYNFMIRRLTPYECFLLQGVKAEDIKLIVSDTQAYKIAGNAINVSVMRALLRVLFKQQTKQKLSLFDFL